MRLLDLADEALLERGSLHAARERYAAAHDQARAAGDVEAAARAAIGLGGIWVHEHRLAAEAATVEAYQRSALEAIEGR